MNKFINLIKKGMLSLRLDAVCIWINATMFSKNIIESHQNAIIILKIELFPQGENRQKSLTHCKCAVNISK